MFLLTTWQDAPRLQKIVAAILVSLFMVGCGFLVYFTGGIKYVYAHTMYLPIVLAAILFKTRGGLIAGIMGGLILGPFMPLDIHTGETQQTLNWLYRMGVFVFVGTLVGHAVQILDTMNRKLIQTYDATIRGWSYALDLRDKETKGHSQRVTDMTMEIAREIKALTSKLPHIHRGALLHDMGKLGVPDAILLKTDALTHEEWEIMIQHPQFAYDMFSSIEYLRPALEIPYCHHEKWDGTGYPQGLEGEEIPLEARIFAIVDMYDALTSDRPYRKACTKEEALSIIQKQRGKHFDPQLVDLFLAVSRKSTLF